jgi:hypothetical protein
MASTKTETTGPGASRSHTDRQTDLLATAQRERDEAVETAARATLAANVLAASVDNGVTDPLTRRRVQHDVDTERERAKREGQLFDYAGAFKRALHAAKGGKGIAPIPSKGATVHPGGRTTPASFQDVAKERAKYRERLRELGLIDPATQSIPGDGGGLTGGGGR